MNKKTISTLISIAALSAVTSSAWAVGTAAGTPVDNTASISYSVSGTPQTSIASAPGAGNSTPGTAGTPTNFLVDKKIDLTVTEGVDVGVVPNTTAQNITYTLQNTGNSTEFFKLEETQVGSDQFNTSSCTITTAPQTITGTDTVELIADTTTTITVACDIPPADGTVTNGATSNLDLKATAVTNTAGGTPYTESVADTVGVDVVLADDNATTADADATDGGARNASHSAVNTYTINTADLTVAKTSAVTADPENGISANAKRIPDATIEYTITVSNAATGSTATGIVISDTIPGDLTYTTCTVSGDGIASCSAAGAAVSSAAFDLDAGETAILKIVATVN